MQIPAALAAIHNFICSHDPDNYEPHTANSDTIHNNHSHDEPNPTFTPEEVDEQWDQIALVIWNKYQWVCEEREIGADESDKPDVGDDDEFDGLYEDLWMYIICEAANTFSVIKCIVFQAS